MNAVREVFFIPDFENGLPEITMEVNPGTLTPDKLKLYKLAGINRLSFGLQSADNRELKLLGRIHTYETFLENYRLAREIGFHNINIDLMSALPGQTLTDWLDTLSQVIQLNPEHISAYSLILEEGTPFFSRYQEEDQDEELDRAIYARTKEVLEKAGYFRYEISNYAKPGYESRHNTSYWVRTDYLGMGLGAASLLNNSRYQNTESLSDYLELSKDYHDIRGSKEELPVYRQMEEFMFLGLRMSKGINKIYFQNLFGTCIESVYGGVLNKSLGEGLIDCKGDTIYLTDKGIDLSNRVLSEFLLDEV